MQIVVLGWLAASDAAAFSVKTTPDGDVVRWDEFPVSYAWNETDASADIDEAAAQIEDAFDAWAEVDKTDLLFRAQFAQGTPASAPDRENLVWISSDWPFDPALLAITDLWSSEDGKIVAFDIHINGTVSWATDGRNDAFDLQAAVTHEVGHAIGLDHTEIEEASMYPSTEPGAVWRRQLHEDDAEAARFLYATDQRPPPNGIQALLMSCNTAPHPFGWLAPLAVASALCRRSGGVR